MKRVPPDRKHKAIYVDFGNPFTRRYFPTWLKGHATALARIRSALPRWVAESEKREDARAREAGESPRPLAAVFDIDEVLLCNIRAAGPGDVISGPGVTKSGVGVVKNSGVKNGEDFHVADFFVDPQTGKKWEQSSTMNPAYPGAVELVREAVRLGVRPFFITGRLEETRGETVQNFIKVGLAGAESTPSGKETPYVKKTPLRVADLSGGVSPEEVSPGEVSPGEVSPGEVSPGEVSPGEVSPGEVSPGEVSPGTLAMVPRALAPGESLRSFKEGARAAIEKKYRIILNVGDQVSDLGEYGERQWLIPHPFYFTY